MPSELCGGALRLIAAAQLEAASREQGAAAVQLMADADYFNSVKALLRDKEISDPEYGEYLIGVARQNRL